MRQIFPVTLLSGFLMFVPSAFGQHGNFAGGRGAGFSGHNAGSSHIGSSGFVSHFSGPAFSGPGRMPSFPTHSFGSAPRMAVGTTPATTFNGPYRSYVPGSGIMDRDRGNRDGNWAGGGDRDHDHDGHRRSPYRGYGYGVYPYYANSWELLPWDLGYSDFGDDSTGDTAQQPVSQATPDQGYGPAYNQGYSDQGYPQPDSGYRPEYGQQPYSDFAPPPPSESAEAIAPEPQLTLIFKDGHQESIHNYVLTPNTVIVMDQASSGHQRRIPLAELNVPATEQAAQQAGVDFAPPA